MYIHSEEQYNTLAKWGTILQQLSAKEKLF